MRRISTISTSSFVLALLGVILFASSAGIIVWKWLHVSYNALDLAIFTQAISETTQGRFFALTIHPQSFFGDHFSPFLILVAGIFYILPSSTTLLGAQWIALLSGIVPVYLLSKHLSSALWRSIIVGLYLLSPIVFNAMIYEFHELPFAAVLALWALLFYETQRFGAFLLFLVLSFTVREDVALLGVAFALLGLIDKRRWHWSVVPFILSGAWLAFSLRAIQGFSATGNYKFDIYYQWLGNTPLSAVNNILTNPLPLLIHLLHPNNVLFLVAVLATVGFLPLLERRSLLFGLPLVLPYLLFEGGAGTITLFSHYPVILLPAFFLGVYRVAKKNPSLHVPLVSKLTAAEPRAPWILLAVVVGYAFITLNPILQSAGAILKDTDRRAGITQDAIKEIGADEAVAASFRSLPVLANRRQIYSLHYHALGHQQFSHEPYAVPDVDTVLYDADDALTYTLQADPGTQRDVAANMRSLLFGRSLQLSRVGDSITLWKKNPSAPPITLYTQQQEAPKMNSVASTGTVQLVGWSLEAQDLAIETLGQNLLPLTMIWRGATPEHAQVMMVVEWLHDDTVLTSQQYPFAYGLFPPSEWDAEAFIKIHQWFALPSQEPTHLRIRVVAYEGYLSFTELRSSERVITNVQTLMDPVTLPLAELSKP